MPKQFSICGANVNQVDGNQMKWVQNPTVKNQTVSRTRC